MALADLTALHDHLAALNPSAAARLLANIRARSALLREFPLAGRSRDDLQPGLRILALRDRVILAYLPGGEEVAIVRLFHGGQDFEAILGNDTAPEDPA